MKKETKTTHKIFFKKQHEKSTQKQMNGHQKEINRNERDPRRNQ